MLTCAVALHGDDRQVSPKVASIQPTDGQAVAIPAGKQAGGTAGSTGVCRTR